MSARRGGLTVWCPGYRVLGGLVVRIGLAAVDRIVHAAERHVAFEVAAVLDRVDAGAIELGGLRQWGA